MKTINRNIITYTDIDNDQDYQEPFALAVYGPHGTGKTRLGTTLPGKIGVTPLNRKTRQTVISTAKEFEKRVVIPDVDLVRSSNPMKGSKLKPDCEKVVEVEIDKDQPWCCAKHNGRWAADRAKQTAFDMYSRADVDSLLIDGFDMLCEDVFIAHYGRSERVSPRDRGPYNKEIIEFLGCISGKHFCLTMGAKEVWKNDKPTGIMDWAGFSNLGYHVNCIAELRTHENYDANKHDEQFMLDVILCQANKGLMGVAGKEVLTDTSISFPMLAKLVYPESDFDSWL